jgi:hypothetical protein
VEKVRRVAGEIDGCILPPKFLADMGNMLYAQC